VAGKNALASLEWCGFAAFGEADPVEFVRRCEQRGLEQRGLELGGLKLVGLYGMSETQALYARQPLDAPVERRALAGGNLTSIDAHAEIRDPQTGALLPPGQSGELYLSGPGLFREYLGNREASASTIGADGFVRTGDLGSGTATGGFVFETRMGDSLRLGGFLVNPAEIDAPICDLPQIAACQTVGVVTARGLRAVSFVILKTGDLDEASIIAHCRAGLAGFKVPARIFALDKFPVSVGPNGEKIQRGRLRDLAAAALAGADGPQP
ncbi:MAG: AMP-binding protein, partial [Fimbriimonadaceae bacterium]|nr:AMP-binding protein [Alphaproteobacteria bacterium]